MKGCTILISHFESVPFLRACVRQIRKYEHPEIHQRIIIIDQSGQPIHKEVVDEFGDAEDITVVKTKGLYSGYGIDFVMRYIDINTEYIAQLHVDAFPISDRWLDMSIRLIEEFDLAFVGQLQVISKPTDTIYPPTPFFAMAQSFNVAKTETYRELSMQAGFTRFHNRLHVDVPMTWENDDWAQWAKPKYHERGSDDDIVAFCWEDRHLRHNKLGLAITGFIQPSFGRIIEDVVFHFGSCRESIGVIETMPGLYRELTAKINADYTDELIDEMVSMAMQNKPPETQILSRNYWDGAKKEASHPSEAINQRIEELKK